MCRICKIRGVHSRHVLISLSLSRLCRCSGVSHQHAGAQTPHPGPPTASVSCSSTVEPTGSRRRYGGDPHLTTSSPEKQLCGSSVSADDLQLSFSYLCVYRRVHSDTFTSAPVNQCSSISLKEISPSQHPERCFLNVSLN